MTDRLNLELYQLEHGGQNNLRVILGMAVQKQEDGQCFINPHPDPVALASLEPTDSKLFAVGLDKDFLLYGQNRAERASLVSKVDAPYDLASPFGSEKLRNPARHPVGLAALLALTENFDLTLASIDPGDYDSTRVLRELPSRILGEPTQYATKIIMLAMNGSITVVSGEPPASKASVVRFDVGTRLLDVQVIEGPEDEENGPGSDDYEPLLPNSPRGEGSAAVEPPAESEEFRTIKGFDL